MSDSKISLKVYSLYPHLSKEEIDKNIEASEAIVPELLETNADKYYNEALQNEADLLYPVMANGNRMTDIDSMKTVTNPVARDIIASRMVELGSASVPGNELLSDDELADAAIPRNMTQADTYQIGLEAMQSDIDLQEAIESQPSVESSSGQDPAPVE